MAEINITGAADLGAAIDGKTDEEINTGLAGKYEQVVKQVMDGMQQHFLPEKAGAESATVQYDVTAPDGVIVFQLKVAGGQCEVVKGAAGPARVTLSLSLADFLRLVSGKLDGMQAFFGGKLKLAGDMMFAQTMQGWFKKI